MGKRLKEYFPLIRSREEVVAEIESNVRLREKFESWTNLQQEDFLELCTGVRGVRLLYDGFFKEIMNPEKNPERMNDFLSHMLQKEVKVLSVLPVDSVRIADEGSLVIMDIVVELEDGSIANVEMQRVGYLFPGQRSACYSADLLLRQYKRVRGERGKKFSYKDIKTVYTIVLYERSPRELHAFPNCSYHYFEQKSDTGLQMELLQKYLFIPIDIYRKNLHNKSEDKRDAWIALLAEDEPESIIELIELYPEFKAIYEEAYNICRNMEEVMDMFSEELYELDKNTVQYMIDEMQDTMDEMQGAIDEMQGTMDEMQGTMDEMQGTMDEMQDTIDEKNCIIEGSIRNAIQLMRRLKLSEEEICESIEKQYHITKEQAENYLYDNK